MATKRQLEIQAAKVRLMQRAKIENQREKIRSDQRKLAEMRVVLKGMK